MTDRLTISQRLSGAYRGALAGWARPDDARVAPSATRDVSRYRQSRDMALGIAWDDPAVWAALGASARLYPRIRQFFNPAMKVNSFYAAAVFPGRIPEGDLPLPPGVRDAIPIVGATPELLFAIRQVHQWSQWQQGKRQVVEIAAAVGECLEEIVDDTSRGRVAKRLWAPEYVREIRLDDYGNVVMYWIEYGTLDADDKPFVFGQRVTKETVSYFRDDQLSPPNPDTEAEFDNPWGGLVPAVWVRHRPEGRDVGLPAVLPSRLMAEIDALTSRIVDYLTKRMKAPKGLAFEGDKHKAVGPDGKPIARPQFRINDSEAFTFLELPDGTTEINLAGDMDPADALPVLDKLLGEVAAQYPEMTAYSELRGMNQVSGVAVEMMLGDVVRKLDDVQSSHDTSERKSLQIATSIGGMRVNAGDWGPESVLTDGQRKFLPFNLDSYRAGDLAFTIAPRPLVPLSTADELDLEKKRFEVLAAAKDADIAPEVVMTRVGFSEEEAARITKDRLAAIQRQRALATSDLNPDGTAPPAL
jgi:hypothetical protein